MKRLMSFILFLLLSVFVVTAVYAQRQDGIRPSFKQGYARSAGESKHPQLWKGLVGAWVPALGVTGNTLHDVSTFKNHGTLVDMDAGTDWVVSEGKHTLDFDGINDHILINDSNNLDITNKFAFVVKLKVNNLSKVDTYILSKVTDTGADNKYSLLWEFVDNSIEFYAGLAGEFTGTNPRTGSAIIINDTDLHQIIYNYNGTNWQGFKDSINIFDTTRTFSLMTSTGNLLFATFTGTSSFANIKIKHILIYNRALTSNEVAWLHRNPYAMFERRE